jgi:hypothetical protein
MRRRRLALATVVFAACAAGGAEASYLLGAAEAKPTGPKPGKPKPGGSGGPAKPGPGGPDNPARPKPGGGAPGAVPPAAGAGQGPPSPGTSNAFDFFRDPQCKRRRSLRHAARFNCRRTGTVTGRVPVTHLGLDINIDTNRDVLIASVPDPVRLFQSAMSSLGNMLWIVFGALLKAILSVVSWAFSLNPFDGRTLPQLERTLAGFYGAFTNPLLTLAIVAIGAWLAWRGLIQRRGAESVGQALLVLALMALGMWVIHQPRETVGRVSAFANEIAMVAIAAPLDRSVSNPSASYSEAMARFWQELSTRPFARLNFDDPDWALSARPPREAIRVAYREACSDQSLVGSEEFARRFARQLRRPELTSLNPADALKDKCAAAAHEVLPRPRTVAQLYANFSPGSESRNALWDYFKDNDRYRDKVAIQGPSGWLIRLPLTALVILGLLGALLMLGWIGIRLFMQAAIALVLTAAMPLAIFMPVFGEAGRRAFRLYGTTLIGALLAKIIYAALLAVCLIAAKLIGLLGWTPFIGLLLMGAFWWSIFLKRAELVSFVSPQSDGGETAAAIRGMTGVYAATQLGRAVTGTARGSHGLARGRMERHDARRVDKDQAASSMATADLNRSAAAYGDAKYERARQTMATRPDTPEGAGARQFVARADTNQAETGSRFGARDLVGLREEMADARSGDLEDPRVLDAQAWRVGKSSAIELTEEDRKTIRAQVSGENAAEQLAGDEGGRMARWRYHYGPGAQGGRNPLAADRIRSRGGAIGRRRAHQRAHRVSRGRDRRSVFRGY